MTFRYHPELIEYQIRAVAALTENDFNPFLHMTNVGTDHETFGIDVYPIPDGEEARRVCSILRSEFPDLIYSDVHEKWLGWRAKVYRDPDTDSGSLYGQTV